MMMKETATQNKEQANTIKNIVVISSDHQSPTIEQLYATIAGWFTALKLQHVLSTKVKASGFLNNSSSNSITITHLVSAENVLTMPTVAITLSQEQLLFLQALGLSEKAIWNTCNGQYCLGERLLSWENPQQDFILANGDY